MTYTIPTFQPGQRVRVRVRPVESACPHCGTIYGMADTGNILTGTVTEQIHSALCPKCDNTIATGEGWYGILNDDSSDPFGPYTAVPYPLMEAIIGNEEAT